MYIVRVIHAFETERRYKNELVQTVYDRTVRCRSVGVCALRGECCVLDRGDDHRMVADLGLVLYLLCAGGISYVFQKHLSASKGKSYFLELVDPGSQEHYTVELPCERPFASIYSLQKLQRTSAPAER